jgi:uncharacterized protein (TIGR00369 family)
MAAAVNDIDLRSYADRIPFARHLGFELTRFEGGESEILYTARPEHLNTFDVTHGGACMTLLDVAMAAAARSETPEIGVVTIEMKTSFMFPAAGPLHARGSVLRRTASFAFTEAKIYDAQERVCAHATGTFKFVKRRLPTGPGSANEMRPPSTD